MALESELAHERWQISLETRCLVVHAAVLFCDLIFLYVHVRSVALQACRQPGGPLFLSHRVHRAHTNLAR